MQIYKSFKPEHRDLFWSWTLQVANLGLNFYGSFFLLLEVRAVGTKFSHQKLCTKIIQFLNLNMMYIFPSLLQTQAFVAVVLIFSILSSL